MKRGGLWLRRCLSALAIPGGAVLIGCRGGAAAWLLFWAGLLPPLLALVWRLAGYLRRRGYSRAPEQSVSACFAALPWRYLPAERDEALAMAEFYESVLFGGRIPTPKEMEAQRAFVEAMRPERRRFLRRAVDLWRIYIGSFC